MDGFLFDSDEEAEKLPKGASNQTGQNEDAEEKANGKEKGKAEKTSVCLLSFRNLECCL